MGSLRMRVFKMRRSWFCNFILFVDSECNAIVVPQNPWITQIIFEEQASLRRQLDEAGEDSWPWTCLVRFYSDSLLDASSSWNIWNSNVSEFGMFRLNWLYRQRLLSLIGSQIVLPLKLKRYSLDSSHLGWDHTVWMSSRHDMKAGIETNYEPTRFHNIIL